MGQQISYRRVDLMLVGLANLMNLIMVYIFIGRILGMSRAVVVGYIWGIFILFFGGAILYNLKERRSRWMVILPLLLFLFLILEIILDYVLTIDFRYTALLGPYLLLYYVAILAMVGYSFIVEKKFGFITLGTYFLSQIAALISYTQVGHG
jgi:hypothetical protein